MYVENSTSGSNSTFMFSNNTLDEPASRLSTQAQISLIINIIINIITCPFTVLLNALVITAVKTRPTLQSYANIVLACLAATDAVSGVLAQPSFILYMMLLLLGVGGKSAVDEVHLSHNSALRAVLVCSSLHLILVTYERVIAIKFTMCYPIFVTEQKLKAAVIAFWLVSISSELVNHATEDSLFSNVITALALIFCVVFVSIFYLLLYKETLRLRRKMKTEQIPQEEVERIAKENKALKTTVLVIGAVLLCFIPLLMHILLVLVWSGNVVYQASLYNVLTPFSRTFSMFNSFLNPLIYCLRQREIRKFVLRFPKAIQVVQPVEN
ncbi:uncharacterized protein [Porites lutea]|uniref:uncharacterized protein n=1 Tax=Porites lutea TaxID=51062 RepID=UPI003CC5F74E